MKTPFGIYNEDLNHFHRIGATYSVKGYSVKVEYHPDEQRWGYQIIDAKGTEVIYSSHRIFKTEGRALLDASDKVQNS